MYIPPSKCSRKSKYSNWKSTIENVEKFKYLGVSVANTNDIHKEIKLRINMGNACNYSLEKILLSCLLSNKLKVNTYKTVILSVVLYVCEI